MSPADFWALDTDEYEALLRYMDKHYQMQKQNR
jgi:hypothetical protein